MRFLIILALFMLPMSLVQFYSSDSYALTSKTAPQEIIFDKTELPRKHGSTLKAHVDEGLNSEKNSVTQVEKGRVENELAKTNIDPPLKTKRVRIVQGKRNIQGMELLSFLLLLKDKNK